MQDPDSPPPQVFRPAEGIDQGAESMATKTGCHGIDTEVTASEIFTERGRADVGQGGRLRVSLGPGGGQIEGDPFGQAQASGSEPRMGCHRRIEVCANTSRHRNGVPLDHEVDIDGTKAQEQVPNISANGIDGVRCGSLVRRPKDPSRRWMKVTKAWELHHAEAIRLVKSGVRPLAPG
jgi:hypothetical protein